MMNSFRFPGEIDLDGEIWKSGLKFLLRRSLKMRQEEEARPEKGLEDDEERSLLEPGDLPPFWKPEMMGAMMQGELLSIRKLPYSEVLHLRTDTGVVAIPISYSMEEVNFWALKGQRLRFVFKGTTETKSGNRVKLFRITKLKAKEKSEEVPF